MGFSWFSCLWPNRSGTGSQIGSDSQAAIPAGSPMETPEKFTKKSLVSHRGAGIADSQASRRANAVAVASNVESVFQSSQPRLPSAENVPPLASSRIISPLPSKESDEMDTSVSFRMMQSDEMEMSQTPPNPPSLSVMSKSPNSMDDQEDSDSLFDLNQGSDASNHDTPEESVASGHKEWSFSRTPPFYLSAVPVINGGVENSDSEDGSAAFFNPYSESSHKVGWSFSQTPHLYPTAMSIINSGVQDMNNREDSDSLFHSQKVSKRAESLVQEKEDSVENREESLVQGGQSRTSMEGDSFQTSMPNRGLIPDLLKSQKNSNSPFTCQDKVEENHKEISTSSSMPFLELPPSSQTSVSLNHTRVCSISPKPNQQLLRGIPSYMSYNPYYSNEEEGD